MLNICSKMPICGLLIYEIIPTAKAAVDTIKPTTFTLTTGTDTFTGGAGDDTFTAAVLTANDADVLAGGSGSDTLNLETASSVTENFDFTSIETVNLTALGTVTVDAKNFGGMTALNSNDAAGAVVVNNLAAATVIGVKGSATNNVDLNYTTGALNGSADKLTVNLNGTGTTATTITADAGFESVEVKTTAASTLTTLTASGATDITLSGNATLTLAEAAIDSFDNITVTNTAKVTYNDIASVKTFNASTNTGGIVGKDLATSAELVNGTSLDKLTMSSTGSLIQTGSGADNINVDSTALLSTNNAIVKLGAGNDTLALTAGTSGEYVYGEAGDDTIYLAAVTTSSDLIDGGEGTDTLNLLGNDLTYAMIAKGIEKVNVGVAGKGTTVNFTSIDSSVIIADATDEDVTFTNLLNGTTYTSSVKKADALSLGFKASQAATLDVKLTKGTAHDITLTNVADATITLGAASDMTAGGGNEDITTDAANTKLTIAATGAFVTDDIVASSTEKLQTVTVTGNNAITIDDITNDKAITSVSVKSTGGAVSVGDIGAGDSTTDVTVSKIEVSSTLGAAAVGDINFDGIDTTVTGAITEITATVSGLAGADAAIGAIIADTLGTVTATSSVGDANIGNITVGLNTATTYTDGTITALKASGLEAASLGILKADKVDSIIVESTKTSGAHAVSIGAITDANSTGKGTVGTVSLTTATGTAGLTSIAAAQVGNVTVSSADDLTVGAITVTNSTNTSTTGNLSFTATGTTSGQDVKLTGTIAVEVGGDLTAKSTGGEVNITANNNITYADTTGAAVVLDGKEGVDLGGATTIENTKGDLSLTLKAASNGVNWQAGTLSIAAGGVGYTSDIDIVVDASAITAGTFGYTAVTNTVITNNGTDSSSSTIVKGGAGANTLKIVTDAAAAGTVTYYGQTDIDTITVTGKAAATIYAESGADVIVGGDGADTINAGAGIDSITGGKGNDSIVLTEGTSSIDTVFFAATAANNGSDTITGFTSGTDTMDFGAFLNGVAKSYFEGAMGANVYAAGENVFVVSDNTNITTLAAQIAADADVNATIALMVFDDGVNTYIYYTTDAAGDGTETLVATLSGITDATSLQTADFLFA